MTDHIGNAMHKMIDRQMERHSWLIRAGEQIRRMNAEELSREPEDEPNKRSGTDS